MYTLKFYTNGWNYVQVSEVQQFNLSLNELNIKINESNNNGRALTFTEYCDELFVNIYNRVMELKLPDGNISPIMKLSTKLFKHGYEYMSTTTEVADMPDDVLLRVLVYVDPNDGRHKYIVYQGYSYLLNDSGKTLETLSRDGQFDE